MNHPNLIALLAALCLSQGCIFAEGEVTPGTPAPDQGQIGADMGDTLDLPVSPDASPDLSVDADLGPAPDQGDDDMAPADMDPDSGADMGEGDMGCPSVAAQCAGLMVECGQTSYPDQCDIDSRERVPLDCGGCEHKGDGFSCQGNVCVDNCEPRSEEELCMAFKCGEHTITDCGVDRTISCKNSCDPNAEVCLQSGACCNTAAQTLEARRTLREAGKCGMQTAVVCEAQTTLMLPLNCDDYAQQEGNVAGSYQCSAARQCVCVGETDAQLCAKAGAACGPKMVTDWCGAPRQLSCGGCGLNVRCCPDNTCSTLGVC